jgi:hypothetical protein
LLISQADAKERNAENKRTRVDRKGLNRAIVRLGAKAWVNLQAEPGLLTRWSLLKPIELRMSSKDGCRSFRIRTKKKEKSGRAFYDFINNLQPTNNQSRPTSEKLLDLADMRESCISSMLINTHAPPLQSKKLVNLFLPLTRAAGWIAAAHHFWDWASWSGTEVELVECGGVQGRNRRDVWRNFCGERLREFPPIGRRERRETFKIPDSEFCCFTSGTRIVL